MPGSCMGLSDCKAAERSNEEPEELGERAGSRGGVGLSAIAAA